ncbi:hypothetical protein [Catellatospora sp. NPDC049609]|uniref:hypothetical protein n=1 Tax=Catellatospora sp. NPDC049609 TaxID=3155505 RepID=UPI00342B05FB
MPTDIEWWQGRRRSPQEKKALSYAKDRRNDYGENDKSSRKSIRRNKRTPNRADRHRERQVLWDATGPAVEPEAAEQVEVRLYVKKSRWMSMRWRKCRDTPLARDVEYKLRRRAELGMVDEAAVEAQVDRIRRRT